MKKLTEIFRQLRTAPRRWLSRLVRLFSPNDFANTRFRVGMTATYRGQEYQITAVNNKVRDARAESGARPSVEASPE